MSKDIVVTGASGFVGTHLVPFLQQAGRKVTPLSLRHQLPDQLPAGTDVLIHLAGKAHDHKGTATADEYFKVNTELTREIFRLFLQSSATLFIHFSTVAAVTDEQVNGVLSEEDVPKPQTPYGRSKLQAEQFLLQTPLPAGKKVFIIRPAMIHGPGDKGNLSLLYSIVSKGIPYPLAAFSNKRSFLSIDNLTYAIERLLSRKDDIASGIYNLVDDTPLATIEVVQLIAEATGKKGKLMAVPKPLVRLIARLGNILPLPLNSKRLAKLTSDYVVSNKKIKQALAIEAFPVTAREGMTRTLNSFASK